MADPPNVYRCRACASTSYARLTHRGPDGVMRYSGMFRCSGCSLVFTDPAAWRERRLRPRRPPEADERTSVSGEPATVRVHREAPSILGGTALLR